MNTSLYIASTGVRAYQGKLDTIANNVANVDSTGYKRREASFLDNLAVSIQNQAEQQKEVGRVSPPGIRTTFGSRVASTQMDTSQGAPKETGNPYDLMLEGAGFFQVRRTSGTTNEVLFTRNGTFQKSLLENGQYQLVNGNGDVLLDQNRNPIVLNGSTEFQVSGDGIVAGSNQRVGIVSVENQQMLKDEGGAYRNMGSTVALANGVNVRQGYLESSNVDLSQEMTDMIKAQRGLQANARALSYADEMMGISNGIIRS